ncbi:patatin-like phospholipase family protein [Flavobacteriaceae bacterium]|nr:patatin-like phospholipase family protein [Flavobacteriaceae bacterium]
MRALVISGGGSKGTFAGGIAQYLLEEEKQSYDLFLGTSTGSLLVSHLALSKIETIKKAFTQVNQSSIFSNNPFLIVKKNGVEQIKINHFNVLKNFIRGRKTFGESYNLRRLIEQQVTIEDFNSLQQSSKEVVVCVANLTGNSVEFKKLKECTYSDFMDWIWISCNYVPFMTLATKDDCEYADGGLGCVIPIEKAITMGAKHVDAILLDTEFQRTHRAHSRNPFDALSTVFGFISDRIEVQDMHIGKLVAEDYNASLRMFYTPEILTSNSLVFNKSQMKKWWQMGFEYSQSKSKKA